MSFAGKELDPRTWWLAAVLFTVAVGATSNLNWQVIGFVLLVPLIWVVSRRRPQVRGFPFYLGLALIIVALRLGFRVIFNGGVPLGEQALLELPFLVFTGPLGEVSLLGPISSTTLSAALSDGLRLANIVLVFGVANLGSSPRKLLRFAPGLLYELASTAAVALNLAPELIRSVSRVRRAREIRGLANGIGSLGHLVIPVLEQTMDRALGLAASMESRGFGREGSAGKKAIGFTRVLFLLALLFAAASSYLLLATNTPLLLASFPLIGALLALLAVFRITNIGRTRTTFEDSTFGFTDWLVIAVVLLLAAVAVSSAGAIPQTLGWF